MILTTSPASTPRHAGRGPGVVALLQGGEDADRHLHAGAAIADRRQDQGRRVFRKAGDAHRAAHRLGDRLIALEARIGTIAAKALDRRIDQPRVKFLELSQPSPSRSIAPGPKISRRTSDWATTSLEQTLAPHRS